MSASEKKTVGRVRTKTYSITLYLVLFAIAIQFGVIVWNFSIRSQVKIDIEAPEIPSEDLSAKTPNPITPTAQPIATEAITTKAAPLGSTSLKPTSTELTSVKDRVETLLSEAQRFLDQGEPSLSRNALLEAESLDPNNIDVLTQLASLAEKIENKQLASDYHKRLSQLTGIPPSSASTTSTTSTLSEKLPPSSNSNPNPNPNANTNSSTLSQANPHELSIKDPIATLAPPVIPIPSTPAPVVSTPTPTLLAVMPSDSSVKKIFVGPLEKKMISTSGAKTEFLLKIPILSNPSSEPIEPGKISIKLYFYELQTDGKIVPSNARLDVSFENKRPNWSTRSEILNALYSLPYSQANRTYYGYRLKIYYRGQFQREISEPENLSEKLP